MPTRLLREGILSSDRIEQLDPPAEVFYRRLMSKVDDFGLFDARPSMLRSSLYPLRVDRVREADIARWIAACEKAGVIALYSHGAKPFGQMVDTDWQTRSEPKHPLPPWGKEKRPQATENSCEQPQTSVTVFGGVFGDGVVVEKEREPRATRLPAPFVLEPEWREWAQEHRPDLDPDLTAAKFADFWHSKPGKDGRKLDWLATWRNWVRDERAPKVSPADIVRITAPPPKPSTYLAEQDAHRALVEAERLARKARVA